MCVGGVLRDVGVECEEHVCVGGVLRDVCVVWSVRDVCGVEC